MTQAHTPAAQPQAADMTSASATPSSDGLSGSESAWLKLALECLPMAGDSTATLRAKWRRLHAPGPAQTPPDGDWRTWLFLGGRGAGKTWAGARWISDLVARRAARRIALVGPTLGDVREVMIEGPSGLMAQAEPGARPVYASSRRRVQWPNGAVAHVFSAEDPDSLRGPQFDAAWCDEIGAWARAEETWDTLAFALRLGRAPRVTATTTPRPTPLVKRLVKLAGRGPRTAARCALTQAATDANVANLAPDFLDTLEDAYAGTRLLRQERLGELLEDPEGALWRRSTIETARVRACDLPELERVVVAVDPPSGVGRDACGIVAAGCAGAGRERRYYVLADSTVRGMRPLEWASRALALARTVGAGEIVVESNQGGEMVRDVLREAGASPETGVRVTLSIAGRSKRARAEPVSAMYDQGKVAHAGVFRELEDEMCAFGAPDDGVAGGVGGSGGSVSGGSGSGRKGVRSPDRVDALVWAVSMLMRARSGPRVWVL